MSYNVQIAKNFKKGAEKLLHKHETLLSKLQELANVLSKTPEIGKNLGRRVYKFRLAFARDNKKDAARMRFVALMRIRTENIYLLSIYEKGTKEKISNKRIKKIMRKQLK